MTSSRYEKLSMLLYYLVANLEVVEMFHNPLFLRDTTPQQPQPENDFAITP